MPDYQKMYLQLFNSITDALEMMEEGKWIAAHELLCSAQTTTEEMYVDESSLECH